MALILTAYDLSGGKTFSSVVTGVNGIWSISATTSGCDGRQQTRVEVFVAGADGNYYAYTIDNQPVSFTIKGNGTKGITLPNMNNTTGKLYVTTNNGSAGLISIDSVVTDSTANIDLVTVALEALTDGSQETQLVDPLGNVIYPSGMPYATAQEITRPANTTAYAALDAIARLAADVAQVETITLSGTPPTKQKETLTLTGTAPEKQVDTVTLTGTSGTAEITLAGGLTKTVTFATGGTTDLTQTAADFVTSFAADYLAEGIVITSSGADIIFTSTTYGLAFVSPAIANLTGDLDGSVANTQANVLVGQAEISAAGGLTKTVVFDTAGGVDLTDTAAQFVTDYAADYLAQGITLTSSTADLIFESTQYGEAIVAPIITNTVGDLDGSVVHTTANVVVGVCQITGAGGLTKDLLFDIAGGVDLTDTAASFVTDYAADYAAEGITVTSSAEDIIFTSDTAGVPFTAPVVTNTAGDLDGTVVHTTANDNIDVLEFTNMSISSGGGGQLMDVKIESDIVAIAETTVRLWFYNVEPSTIIGDNVAFNHVYVDKNVRMFYVDVVMNAQDGSSASIVGQTSVIKEYNCSLSSLFVQVQTITGFTPTSGGKVNITLSALILT